MPAAHAPVRPEGEVIPTAVAEKIHHGRLTEAHMKAHDEVEGLKVDANNKF